MWGTLTLIFNKEAERGRELPHLASPYKGEEEEAAPITKVRKTFLFPSFVRRGEGR